MKRPLILVTNDDGINAPGIRTLISVVKNIGDVIVVAPDSPQSGMGHAITINSTLHSSKITPKNSEIIEYSCSGTPADCVKLAINELMPRKPDLCVSGINHGSNSSINVIYSGTMSAAIEAGIEGVPAIGFSLLDYSWNADFSQSKDFIRKITLNALDNGMAAATLLPSQGSSKNSDELRFAFDGDAVLFSDASERIFKEQGLDAFTENEKKTKEKLKQTYFVEQIKKLSEQEQQRLNLSITNLPKFENDFVQYDKKFI